MYSPGSASGGSGCTTDCVVTDPSGSQTITQPDSTNFNVNGPSSGSAYVAFNLYGGAFGVNANSGVDFNLNGGADTAAFDVNTGSGGFGFNTDNNGSFNLNIGGNGSVVINDNVWYWRD